MKLSHIAEAKCQACGVDAELLNAQCDQDVALLKDQSNNAVTAFATKLRGELAPYLQETENIGNIDTLPINEKILLRNLIEIKQVLLANGILLK